MSRIDLTTLRKGMLSRIGNARQGASRRATLWLERLENRDVPALISWDGGGGDNLWATALNWSGDVLPTAADEVRIDSPGTTITLGSRTVQVLRLDSSAAIAVTNANLTITGDSHLTGGVSVDRSNLYVSGTGVELDVAGPTAIGRSSISVTNGAVARFPQLVSYSGGSSGAGGPSYAFVVDGAGSLLDVSGLQTVAGVQDTPGFNALSVNIQNGGTLSAASLTSVAGGNVNFTVIGPGSVLDVPSLASIGSSGSFSVRDHGLVAAPSLTTLSGQSLSLEPTATFPTGQLIRLTGGGLAFSGTTRDFDRLAVIDGSTIEPGAGLELVLPAVTGTMQSVNLRALGGAVLRIPNATGYNGGSSGAGRPSYSFTVDGMGSTLDLPGLQTLTGVQDTPGFNTLAVTVRNRGLLAASSLVTISGGNVNFDIAGSGSVLAAQALTSVASLGTFSVTNQGAVVAPALQNLSGQTLSLDATGVFPTEQVTRLGGLVVSGATRDFGRVATIDGARIRPGPGVEVVLPGVTGTVTQANLVAAAGAVIRLPNLTAYDGGGGGAGRPSFEFTATGANSLIDLPALRTILGVSDAPGFNTLSVQADGRGTIRMPALTSVTRGNTNLKAVGAGSRVDLGSLGTISTFGTVSASTGGELAFGPVLSISNAALSHDAASRMTGLTALTLASGSLSADAVAGLSALTSLTVTGGTATVSGGLTLDTLAFGGGSLAVSGPVSVRTTFGWTGGTLSVPGTLRIGDAAVGTISGSVAKVFGGSLENAGRLTYSGSGLQFGPSGQAGVITNLPGRTFTLVGDGDITVASVNPDHAVRNDGSLVRFGTGETRINVPVVSSGSVTLQEGSLTFNGGAVGLILQSAAAVSTLPGTTLSSTGSVGGTTANADSFSALGTTTLAGGTLAAPLTFEAMGSDRGASGSGYGRNFAYGTVRLDNAYVRLVDQADNAAGAGPEALYVDTLVVSAGSTLDLNGFHLYARALQIAGTVIGGTVTPVQDGGSLATSATTFGTISAAGEVDEWVLYGRAGQRIAVSVNPGTTGTPAPISPVLGFAEVQLVSPEGAVLASATNTTSGVLVSLVLDSLPADGSYTIRVRAPAAHPAATGNYLLTGLNASVDVAPLVLNQPVVGLLENYRSIDRWTFAGTAGQQVRLAFGGASFAGVRFSLTGPGGWAGFNDLPGDSALVTLPADGAYQVEVVSAGFGAGSYTFRLNQTTQTPLALSTPFTGRFTGPGFAQLFAIDLPAGSPLNVVLDSAAAAGAEVYLQLGSPPTRQTYDYQGSGFGTTQSVLVPFAAPGRWYVLVFSNSIPAGTDFTVRADATPVLLTGGPQSVTANDQTALSVSGAGFLPGSTLEVVAADGTRIAARSLGVDSTTQLTANFDLSGVAPGTYDVRVTLPTGATTTRPAALQVLPAGQPNLETRLIPPSALGRSALATMYVEYANTGTAPMAAPILTVRPADFDNTNKPLLTLQASRVSTAAWSGSQVPDGVGYSVQIYAQGASPGLLRPGERIRVPVYFVGIRQPWDLSNVQVEMDVRVTRAETTTPADWDAVLPTLRPEWIGPEAWAAVSANLRAQIGTTWGDYIRMLSDNAVYLTRLGQQVRDVGQLFGYEVMQALGISAIGPVASATDAAIPTPGIGLSFSRSYAANIVERYDVGPFGRGWIAPWQTRLGLDSNGVVVISDASGSPTWSAG